ncbi:HlyD family efflux transporter periplasmic adaptor subunit [Sandarakinorhabdus limnophila]|jgi:adhesin transport system membrane fusion protein|uniref:HlyD family efflux transporter periplasmic adaptor subunit n=1 Tax=Sandarakinorhabdus limnophila TaxID=210512 RepID=UPI0026EF747A|nr:HlyD family efflux transporter periplasmic adaptor subunit [Sandarakinorhabdus limnophila]
MEKLKSIRLSSWIIITSAAAVLSFFLWAEWAEIDQLTRAMGKVIPVDKVQVIQTADGGVVEEMRVREGDAVRKGQLLVRIDRVKVQAAVGESQAKVAAFRSIMSRIEAELYDRPLNFPAELRSYPDFIANQTALFTKRRQAISSEIAALEAVKRLMQQELELNIPLVSSGDVARAEIIRMQRGIADVQGQIVNKRSKYQQDLQAEFAKVEEELVSAQQILAQRMDALAATELRSPANGIVKNVRFTTVGAVLRPGDEVMQIVPTGEKLIVEAQVSPRDIAFIKVGQKASVKFDTFDSAIYGSGVGVVSYVSPDTLVEQRPDGESATYYRINLDVDISEMRPKRDNEQIIIQPGMTLTAEIKTGENTVLRYLTKPILKTVSESLSER